MDDRPLLSYGEILLAMFLWGSLSPAGKPVLEHVPATHVALVRTLVAFATLGLLVLLRGKGREALAELRRRPWDSAVLGSLGFFLSTILMMIALQSLPASVVAIIVNASPLWISLAVIVLHRPGDSLRMALGAGLGLMGIGLVLFRGEHPMALLAGEGLDLRGVTAALLSSGAIAGQVLWARRVLPGRDPIIMTGLACAWGALPLLAIAWANGGIAPLLVAPLVTQVLLLYLGVGCTAANFGLLYHALQRVPAERAASFQYLVPLISALLAFVFLGETLTWSLLLGGLAILSGIALAQGQLRRKLRVVANNRTRTQHNSAATH